MNQEPKQSNPNGGNRGVNLVLGIFFTIGWIAGLCYVGVFVLMGDIFALASAGVQLAGKPPTQTQDNVFFIIQLVGFVLAAIAGILGGASFYCPSHRKRLLRLFWTLLVAGVLVFISAIFVFFFF